MAKIERKEIVAFLGKIWAFERLDPAYLERLAGLVKVRELKKGEVVWLQGQQVTCFTIVYYGQLRAVRGSVGGSKKLLSTLTPGYHFGLAEMITHATSAITLVADGAATILVIRYKSLQEMLLSDGDICYRLMQTMARAIFSLTRELERASFENVHTRLARLLLQNKPHLSGTNMTQGLGNPVTHKQLAEQLGVNRETVSRAIAEFKRKKLIATAYRNITVLDRDGLMEYVDDYDQW